jgi:hypothetical protein
MARARDLATKACFRWELGHLIGPASLITNELVANAVAHAHTMIDVRLTLGRRHLLIAVRDGSPAVPLLDNSAPHVTLTGRGYHWSTRSRSDGEPPVPTAARRCGPHSANARNPVTVRCHSQLTASRTGTAHRRDPIARAGGGRDVQ